MVLQRIGRYNIIRRIGAGGMAEVFLAGARGAQGIEKLLVLKKIHPVLARNTRFIDMFVDEARVAMRLNHTNIVQVYAFEQIDETFILAMEYVDGLDLLALQNTAREHQLRLPFGLAAYIAQEVAKGLDCAHSRRDDRGIPLEIVHRDVSPQNILIAFEGAVKVTDFGVARARWLHDEPVEAIKGKFAYMAPEQASAMPVDRRTDIYALGIVLHEMLTGQPLLDLKNCDSPLSYVREVKHRPPIEYDASIPRSLNEVVCRAMAPNPHERFATAREMGRALSQYLHREADIYDAQALESWIDEHLPFKKTESGSDMESSEVAPTIAIKNVPTTMDRPHGSSGRFGEIEQRVVVVLSGQWRLSTQSAPDEVLSELTKLIGDMAYKADGVLNQGSNGFYIFLGLARSSPEDAISGLRLAHDMLDTTRALSRDHRLRLEIKLSVCLGAIRCVPEEAGGVSEFEPESKLLSKVGQLLSAVQYGAICADEGVFQLARQAYHFEMSAGASGPGIRRVVGAKSRLERIAEAAQEGTFQNRRAELDRLRGGLEEAAEGQVVLLKVTGEKGVGKSRLVDEFLRRSATESLNVLRTRCLFVERDRPLSAAAAAVRAALALDDGPVSSPLPGTFNDLLQGAPAYRRRQAQFFEALLNAPQRFWSEYSGGQRELVRRTAFGLGVLLSVLAKSRPTILVVEDAHWLDDPSVDVLWELANHRLQLPILVLIIGQPTTLMGRDIVGLQTLVVDELPDQELMKIITERFGSSESMQEIARQICGRVQGNPFFANEIMDALIQKRIVVRVTGREPPEYRQAKPGSIQLPATMEGVARRQIDALPPNRRTVLRAASAVGARFTDRTIEQLVGREVLEDIESLITQGILVQMPTGPKAVPTYRFRQPMIREAAYSGLSVEDRHRIHQTMVQRLMKRVERGETVPPVRIAWHLSHLGENQAAAKYYIAAGDAAMEIYSGPQALKLYDRAIAHLKEGTIERFEAISQREKVLRDLGRYAEREEDVRAMGQMAAALGDDRLKARAVNRRARLQYDWGDFLAAAESLRQSLEVVAGVGDATEQVEALRLLAYVAAEQGHLIRALDCCDRALEVVRQTDASAHYLRGRALGIKGYVLQTMGHLNEATTPLAEALVLFRRLSKRRNESQVMSNMALLAQARGEMTLAIEFLRSAMRIDSEVRDISARGRKIANLGSIYVELGDFEAAFAALSEASRLCRENQERVGEVEAELGRAEFELLRDEPDTAREILERLGRKGFVTQSRLLLIRHRQLAALVLLRCERIRSARQMADEATRIALEAGMTGEAIHGGVRQGLVLAELGLPGEALAATRRATDLLHNLGRVRCAEEVWWYHALTLYRVGNRTRAESARDQALQAAHQKRDRIADSQQRRMFEAHPLIRAITSGLDAVPTSGVGGPTSGGGAQ